MRTPKLEVKRSGGKFGEDRHPTFCPPSDMNTDTLKAIDRKLGELIDLFRTAFIDDRMVE